MGHRPGDTKHRALLHRRRRVRTMGMVMTSFVGIVSDVRTVDSPYGQFLNIFVTGGTPLERHCGDLLPISCVSADVVRYLIPDTNGFADGLATLANFCFSASY